MTAMDLGSVELSYVQRYSQSCVALWRAPRDWLTPMKGGENNQITITFKSFTMETDSAWVKISFTLAHFVPLILKRGINV